ncbi:predicted protein [Sclerotinia sclerotiorum 1980 UF-70]|uniref:Uncharacterized protein n=1 Tax=Sclerotinia sclerotiorum (strain ATCC 18683 / 1980 / Ss-1) TaxID=665079 RepID=A7EAH3_SCLS1|nr:predicted protein [Sclerotinia sclerotiorum 1980 UF-70]EDN99451.1 predicted protein [Sclerotinia sclerotiorum 1980 UF-70]
MVYSTMYIYYRGYFSSSTSNMKRKLYCIWVSDGHGHPKHSNKKILGYLPCTNATGFILVVSRCTSNMKRKLYCIWVSDGHGHPKHPNKKIHTKMVYPTMYRYSYCQKV